MPRVRFRIPDIGGYQPAIENRVDDKVLMITGRNFAFDSKGPKSAFGTRLLAQGQVIEVEGGVAQNVTVGTENFLFTTQGCWVLSKDKQSWIKIYDLSTLFNIVNNKAELKWTGAYLSNGIYLCHPKYGFFKFGEDVLIPLDSDDIPGLNERPLAVAETNGRLIVLGSLFVSWSAPSNAENMTPALGGAGQQLLSDRITGVPTHLAAFQNGFLVWTEKDCMLAEFIGGDNVFRFTRVATEQIPLGSFTVENMPDGSQLICTRQGLHRIVNGNEPEIVTPIFNEFFREVLRHEPGILVRLTYHMEADHLYVQLRDWTNHYVRTYVLSLALDKWGIFSDRHLGAIRYSSARGAFGYVDSNGTAHRFVDYTYNREVTPHVFEGLDSEIEIGYVKPPEMYERGDIDTLHEMQEIFLGSRPARPSWSPQDVIDMGIVESNAPEFSWMVYADFTEASMEFLIDNVPVTLEQMFDGVNPDAIDSSGMIFPGPTEPDNAPSFTALARASILAGAQADTGITFFAEWDWGGYEPQGTFESGYIGVLGDDVNLADYYWYVGISSGQLFSNSWEGQPRTEQEKRLNSRLESADSQWLGGDSPTWLNSGRIRFVTTFYFPVSPGVYGHYYSVNGGFNVGMFNGPITDSLATFLDAVAIGLIGNNTVWGGMLENATLKRIGFGPGITSQLEVDRLAADTLPLTIEIHPNTDGIFKVVGEPYSMSNREAQSGTRNRFPITPPPLGKIGVVYRGFKVQAFGGRPAYTYTIQSGALPDGVVLGVDGTVSGTPTQDGTFTCTIRGTDALGATIDTAAITIRIQKAIWVLMDERCAASGVLGASALYSIPNVNLGSPHATRYILVVTRALTGSDPDSALLDGVPMTRIAGPGYVPDPDSVIGENTFWLISAPNGVTGLLQLEADDTGNMRMETNINVFALYDVNPVPTDTDVFGYVVPGAFGGPGLTVHNGTITIPAGGFAIGSMNTHIQSGLGVPASYLPDVMQWTGLGEQTEFCYSVDGPGAFRDVSCCTLAVKDSVAEIVDDPFSVTLRTDLLWGASFYNEISSVVTVAFEPAV